MSLESFTILIILLYVNHVCCSTCKSESDTNITLLHGAVLEEKNFLVNRKSNNTDMTYERNLLSNERKKSRRERIRKRKEKTGKNRKKFHRVFDYFDRNNEKIDLVRNRTIQMLRKGVRILDAQEKKEVVKTEPPFRMNSTLMDKILSFRLAKQNVLASVSGAYTLPVGFPAPKRNSDSSEQSPLRLNTRFINETFFYHSANSYPNSTKPPQTLLSSVPPPNFLGNLTKHYQSRLNAFHDSRTPTSYTKALLHQITAVLKNLTECPYRGCSENGTSPSGTEDPCSKWLHCKKNLDMAFSGDGNDLPSCPCTYPSTIFYDNSIWDNRLNKYFKWRDASGEGEKINIYKPGAAHCIRSLITRTSTSLSSQQCCYDRSLLLLTRGSGAGTVHFVSPDASKPLHFAVDLLPWRLCKGDFTRYNSARTPNNGNNCPQNPNDELYELEVKLSKNY